MKDFKEILKEKYILEQEQEEPVDLGNKIFRIAQVIKVAQQPKVVKKLTKLKKSKPKEYKIIEDAINLLDTFIL